MMSKILIIFSLAAILLSCNKNIYQYQSDDFIEIIELKKDKTFIFTVKDKDKGEQFNVNGDYRLRDSNFIEFTFNPVDRSDLKFLPINEAQVEFEQINQKDSQFSYHLLVLEGSLKDPIWAIEVKAFSEKKELHSKLTSREGKVTFESLDPIDTFVLQCENCVPTTIRLEDESSYSIRIIWEPKGARYGRGDMIPDRGPIKIMKVQIKSGRIIHIMQNDLSSKQFIKK